jgi:hypothetical protein
VSQEKLFSDQLLSRLIIGCIDNRAFNGDAARNPFNFQHFSLSKLAAHIDGQQHDFANKQYITSFMSLFNEMGEENRDEGNDIDRSDFADGYALYAFDLSPDLSENDHFKLTRQETVCLDMKFVVALPHTVTVVAYAEFENIFEIDRNRNVVFDFNN